MAPRTSCSAKRGSKALIQTPETAREACVRLQESQNEDDDSDGDDDGRSEEGRPPGGDLVNDATLAKLREVLAVFPPDALQALVTKPLAETRPLLEKDHHEEIEIPPFFCQ